MSIKLYANDRCIAECDGTMKITQNGTYSSSQEDGYSSVIINTDQETKKKPCNCPNCGAPISGYICEYCGTEVKHYEPTEDLDDLIRQRRLAEIQASQEFQTRCLLNTLNNFTIDTQIMNIQDSINTAVDSKTNCQHIPINKNNDDETIAEKEPDISISKADEEFVSTIFVFMIGMVLFTIFAIVVTIIYNLF